MELSTSRRTRYNNDIGKLLTWFNTNDPFDTNLSTLRSLSTGLTASSNDKIDCDDVENVGLRIQAKLDGVCFEGATIKRTDQVRTLACIQNEIKVNNEPDHIDPLVLFGRLTALAQRDDVMAQFKYELTSKPTALFKDGLMKKPTKSVLRNYLTKDETPSKVVAKVCVLDGGALLYNVKWLPNSSYSVIAEYYTKFIKNNYGKYGSMCVVFDGYDDPLFTKAHEHARRKGLSSADINISDLSMHVTVKRKAFQHNPHNNMELVRVLRDRFASNGIATEQSRSDADALVAILAVSGAILFNKSIKSSTAPDRWLEALITAIYKKGQKNMVDNYRPKSLTSVFSNIFESIVRDTIVKHMNINKLFADEQHGFVPMRNCATRLLLCLDEWSKIMEDSGCVDIIYTDFSKTFDSVPHLRLLRKVESYGIKGNLLKWIGSFLSNRRQRVKVADSVSRWAPVKSGVPQGSVMGPILFVLFINDMPNTLMNTCKLFADDAKIFCNAFNSKLQGDIDELALWSEKWQSPFNVNKCNCQTASKNTCGTKICSCRKHGLKCM